MKNCMIIRAKSSTLVAITILSLMFLLTFTHFFFNAYTLISDASNGCYIPPKSNIFTFNLTQVDEGSGEYWRYGEDGRNYYFFSLEDSDVYFYQSKNNNCSMIDPLDTLTWCSKQQANRYD